MHNNFILVHYYTRVPSSCSTIPINLLLNQNVYTTKIVYKKTSRTLLLNPIRARHYINNTLLLSWV